MLAAAARQKGRRPADTLQLAAGNGHERHIKRLMSNGHDDVRSRHLAVQKVAPDLRGVTLAEQLRLHRHAAAARTPPRCRVFAAAAAAACVRGFGLELGSG